MQVAGTDTASYLPDITIIIFFLYNRIPDSWVGISIQLKAFPSADSCEVRSGHDSILAKESEQKLIIGTSWKAFSKEQTPQSDFFISLSLHSGCLLLRMCAWYLGAHNRLMTHRTKAYKIRMLIERAERAWLKIKSWKYAKKCGAIFKNNFRGEGAILSVTQNAKAIKRKLNISDKLKFKIFCMGKITSQKVK